MNRLRKYKKIHIILLVAITLLAFSGTFNNRFVWDDEGDLENPFIKEISLNNINSLLFHKYPGGIYRPVMGISFLIEYNLWNLNPLPYHIRNVILYIINVLLVYFFILKITEEPELALLTSLIFSVHPLHCEVVAWISPGAYLYGFAFFMASLLSFDKYLSIASKKFYIMSLIFFLLSILAKENILALFPLYIFYDISFSEKPNLKKFFKKIPLYLPFMIISMSCMYLYMSITDRVKEQVGQTRLESFLMDLQIFGSIYLKNLLYPAKLHPMYNISQVNIAWIIISFIMVSLIFISLIISWKRSKVVFYLIIWFFIPLIPVTHFIVSVNFLAADRYIYFSSLSFCFFLALMFVKIYKFKDKNIYKILSLSLAVLLLTVYTVITIKQNKIWTDNLTLWTHVYNLGEEYKKNPLLLYNLGHAYFQEGDFSESIKFFEESLKYSKEENCKLRIELGISYLEKENYSKALNNFQIAQEIEPHNFIPHKNMGIVYYHTGEYNKAREEFEKSLTLNPAQPDVRDFLDFLSSELINKTEN